MFTNFFGGFPKAKVGKKSTPYIVHIQRQEGKGRSGVEEVWNHQGCRMLECIEGCFHTRVFDKVRHRYFHKKCYKQYIHIRSTCHIKEVKRNWLQVVQKVPTGRRDFSNEHVLSGSQCLPPATCRWHTQVNLTTLIAFRPLLKTFLRIWSDVEIVETWWSGGNSLVKPRRPSRAVQPPPSSHGSITIATPCQMKIHQNKVWCNIFGTGKAYNLGMFVVWFHPLLLQVCEHNANLGWMKYHETGQAKIYGLPLWMPRKHGFQRVPWWQQLLT